MRNLSDFWTETLAAEMGVAGDAVCVNDRNERVSHCNPVIEGLAYDSHAVKPGFVYFALPGLHADGHAFIDDAIARGAVIVIHEKPLQTYSNGVLYIKVMSPRRAMSAFSAAYYNNPSRHLTVIGVTGTEGKSTTVSLVFQLLRLMGKRAGFISTVEYCVNGADVLPNPEHQTTPEATVIHEKLSLMRDSGCDYAVIEASSHGLSPKTARLLDVSFDVGIMTNVTHEHLEFHGTWEQYRDDKANLFRAAVKFCVANADDKSAVFFRSCAKVPTYLFSSCGDTNSELSVTAITPRADGNDYTIRDMTNEYHIHDYLPGAFNALNVLAAVITVAKLCDTPYHEALAQVEKLKPVRGRMTRIDLGQNFEVLVDYAHTPSSFETIFPPLRARLDDENDRDVGADGGKRKMIAVFGSAGERDTQKRPQQGKIAAAYSDIIVLTDEDPRGEEPEAILEEIAAGITESRFVRGKNLFLISERRTAIRAAFEMAEEGDIVLLLGKGHENTIIYSRNGRATIPWNEIAEAEAALKEMQLRRRG